MEYISGVDKGQVIMLSDCVNDYIEAENPVCVIGLCPSVEAV